MNGRGFGLRRAILGVFLAAALISLGILLLSRTGTPVEPLVPSVDATPTYPASVSPSPKGTPGSLSPVPARTATPPPVASATPIVLAGGILHLVDRQNAIPANYVPPDLVKLTTVRTTIANQQVRRIILPFLERLIGDAKGAGHDLVVSSAYRSYSEQEMVYAYWQRTLGKSEADKVSAQPGHSEHQLGTTIDLTSAGVGYELSEIFASTPEGRWLRDNAHRYGFVISYPEGKEAVTGYAYEPWHIRYVGLDTATAIYSKGMTLEEYLRSRR